MDEAEAAALFRTAVALFGKWGPTEDQAAILLDLAVRSCRNWKVTGPQRIDCDDRARLSNLMKPQGAGV